MNELIIPNNIGDLTRIQKVISQYYIMRITNDILHIKRSDLFVFTSLNDVLKSSRFNIKKSDKKFFINNSIDINDPTNTSFRTLQIYYFINIIENFRRTLFLIDKIDKPDFFTIALILIVRHIHFKEMLKEILYAQNNFKNYTIEYINETINQISNNLSLRREENRLDIKIQRLLNLVEKIFDKTFKKIIKELK
jgi:hypothetical protein